MRDPRGWSVMRPDGHVMHKFKSRAAARQWIARIVGTGRGYKVVRRAIERGEDRT